MKKRQIGATDCAVLRDVKPITAPHVAGSLLADLHRALRACEARPPHGRICAMTRFRAGNSVGNAVKLLARRISLARNARGNPRQRQTRRN
jgi:hypothetical protein